MPAGAGDKMLIESQKHLAPILLNEKGHWGTIRPERWNRMAEFILECGVITSRKEREFTNEYLPQ